MSQHKLMIFAKAPRPGHVKTRLDLPPEDAARWHEAFVLDVVERHQRPGRHLTVWRADQSAHPFWNGLDVHQKDQRGSSLGERMAHAFGEEVGAENSVVILGTDSPSLPPQFVDDAFSLLEEKDVVVGPACDGGYYLLGMNRFQPSLFPVDMPWGTQSVLPTTLDLIRNAELSLGMLPFWYDVDRPADLAFLERHLGVLANQGVPMPQETLARFSLLRSLTGVHHGDG